MINYWTLIYGRRKTGKTTLLKNCLKYDYYVTIADEQEGLLENGERKKIEQILKDIREEFRKGRDVEIEDLQIGWEVQLGK